MAYSKTPVRHSATLRDVDKPVNKIEARIYNAAADSSGQRKSLTMGKSLKNTETKQQKVIVFMRVVFVKVGEICTMEEHFHGELFVQARWREPLLDRVKNPDSVDFTKYWNPNLTIDNENEDTEETIWSLVTFEKDMAFIVERRKLQGSYLANMVLGQFPFDTQELPLTVLSARNQEEILLIPDPEEPSTINVQSYIDNQEWHVYKFVESRVDVVNRVMQGASEDHPRFSSRCFASRRIGFYMWNIFLALVFITSLTFTTFAVDIESGNRLNIAYMLILTNVTFKTAIAEKLPKISYLTYIDMYIILSLLTQCVISIWHSMITTVFAGNTEEYINETDFRVFVGMSILFVVAQCGYLLFIYRSVTRVRSFYTKKDKAHVQELSNHPNRSVRQSVMRPDLA